MVGVKMDVEVITNLISNTGVPIAMLIWFATRFETIMKNMTDANKELIEEVKKWRTTNQ